MKVIKNLAFIILAMFAFKANAQTDKATTTRIVDEKNYVFTATTAIPLNSNDINKVFSKMPGVTPGGSINLTGSEYDLTISTDSVIAYLPFYGRAYNATLNPDENGFKFTSKDFSYTNTKRKKGGWDIVINTKDVKDNVRMTLSIGESGYATLSVQSTNRQSITYNGYLKEPKLKKL